MLGAPVITPSEIAYLQSVYPSLELKPPTSQMNQALLYYLRGYSAAAAARAAGYASSASLKEFLESAEGQAILGFIREQQFEGINITRELLNTMLMDSHAKAATAMEEIAAIRELGKMNDLYPGARTTVNIDMARDIENISQLKRISTAALLQMAPAEIQALLAPPVPITFEGEIIDITVTDRELDL